MKNPWISWGVFKGLLYTRVFGPTWVHSLTVLRRGGHALENVGTVS